MKVIAVIPAYNEASRIGDVIRKTTTHVDITLVVDDGSNDSTPVKAAEAGALVIRHPQNCGPGAATMTGIEAARKLGADAVVTLDGDGQHDPADIPDLLDSILKEKADIVFGNRFGARNRIPVIRRILNGLGNVLTLVATGLLVTDSQSGFKALGPRALHDIDLRMSGFEFCTEIVREAAQRRWRIAEAPIKVVYSEYTLAKGQSFAQGIKTAFKILLRSFLR